MEKHKCKTYFCVNFKFDAEENAKLLRERKSCSPREIGISNKDEVEKFLIGNLKVVPEWKRRRFVIGLNCKYDIDVNKMIRVTLKDLFGKEDKIRELQNKFSVTCVLEVVPCIAAEADEPKQYISPEKDIIEFLHNSDTALDIDYYVV